MTEPAIQFLIKKGFHDDYGARPLRRAIERYIEDPLAENLLRGDFDGGATIWVECKGDADELSFSSTEPKSESPIEASA